MKNLEEAVEELSLADDSDKIPYLIGEVFICQELEKTLVNLLFILFFVIPTKELVLLVTISYTFRFYH